MKHKLVRIGTTSLMLLAFSASSALAHVSVKPNQAGVGAFQTFTVGVPNERDVPTTAVRLVMPQGLEHVSPNVKPGWTIEIKHGPVPSGQTDEHQGDEHAAEGPVTEIIWTGGSIPRGQRDDFLFSAKVPSQESTLQWKAYQTYQGGNVVAWELDPKAEQPKDAQGNPDFSKVGPLSETNVIDDLSQKDGDDRLVEARIADDSEDGFTPLIAYVALAVGALALIISLKDKVLKSQA